MPTPSSFSNKLPTPNTNVSFFIDLRAHLGRLVYLFFVLFVFLDKLPATDDGRSLATLLDIVMIKYQINMNDSEKDEEPHQEMMNLASHQIPAHQGNCPCEQLQEEGMAHLCVQAESCENL